MNVKAILAAKGGDIVTIEPSADLAAAAKLLSKHKIGAVLIKGAGGRIAGILSERDIVRAVSETTHSRSKWRSDDASGHTCGGDGTLPHRER
jgi:CBS domain-containing protein